MFISKVFLYLTDICGFISAYFAYCLESFFSLTNPKPLKVSLKWFMFIYNVLVRKSKIPKSHHYITTPRLGIGVSTDTYSACVSCR